MIYCPWFYNSPAIFTMQVAICHKNYWCQFKATGAIKVFEKSSAAPTSGLSKVKWLMQQSFKTPLRSTSLVGKKLAGSGRK